MSDPLSLISAAFDSRAERYDESAMHRAVATATAEWRRVLRPGGRLVTGTFQKTDTSGHGAPEQPSAQRPYARDHAPYSSAASLSATFDRYGFTLRRHREWSDDIDELLLAELVVQTP